MLDRSMNWCARSVGAVDCPAIGQSELALAPPQEPLLDPFNIVANWHKRALSGLAGCLLFQVVPRPKVCDLRSQIFSINAHVHPPCRFQNSLFASSPKTGEIGNRFRWGEGAPILAPFRPYSPFRHGALVEKWSKAALHPRHIPGGNYWDVLVLFLVVSI